MATRRHRNEGQPQEYDLRSARDWRTYERDLHGMPPRCTADSVISLAAMSILLNLFMSESEWTRSLFPSSAPLTPRSRRLRYRQPHPPRLPFRNASGLRAHRTSSLRPSLPPAKPTPMLTRPDASVPSPSHSTNCPSTRTSRAVPSSSPLLTTSVSRLFATYPMLS